MMLERNNNLDNFRLFCKYKEFKIKYANVIFRKIQEKIGKSSVLEGYGWGRYG
jgi:hypothetical protein